MLESQIIPLHANLFHHALRLRIAQRGERNHFRQRQFIEGKCKRCARALRVHLSEDRKFAGMPLTQQQSLGLDFVEVRHWWFRKPWYSSSLRRLCERLLHEEA